MSLIISDNFNRADSASLGVADTGQTWNTTHGNWGISSNTARSVYPDLFGSASAVIDAGTSEVYAQLDLVNPSQWGIYVPNAGIVVRYADATNTYVVALQSDGGVPASYTLFLYDFKIPGVVWTSGSVLQPADGSTIAVNCCGLDFSMYLNGTLIGTYTDGFAPATYGTSCGLWAYAGTVPLFGGNYSRVDNFIVNSGVGCSESFNCTNNECIDPGDGSGTYATLAECLSACGVAASYNCISESCIDPGDGSGAFTTLSDCLNSGCGGAVTGTNTTRFDSGIGNSWYVTLPIIDSGEELRSKVLKTVRETGKVTNASIEVFGYDVTDPIVVADLEDGTNSTTGALSLNNTTQVAQSERIPLNVPNAVLHTVRIQGDDTGQSTRDTLHEIVMEQAEQGVRR